MQLVHSIGGTISPKSVVASGNGIVLAQNMMYQHTITAYSSAGDLVRRSPTASISRVSASPDHPGDLARARRSRPRSRPTGAMSTSRTTRCTARASDPKAPTRAHRRRDTTTASSIASNVQRLAVDQVIKVGPVPKYVATTPDGRYVLVTNWCGYDMSVVDRATGREVRRIPLGPYPRGIVGLARLRTAYVAVMGTRTSRRSTCATFAVSWMYGVGSGPRHLVLSPDGRWLYATLNGAGHDRQDRSRRTAPSSRG